MYLFRWLTSRTVRKAGELGDAVRKILNHQRDELKPEAVAAMESALTDYRRLLREGDTAAIKAGMDALESTANQWLKPYPSSSIRENVVMLLEIAILIIGSRAFLVQPMVIPTGSAQPTFYGVTYSDLRDKPGAAVPALPVRLWERWIHAVSYYHIVAKEDCRLDLRRPWDEKPTMVFPFVKKQNLYTDKGAITVWFPPDDFGRQLGFFDETTRSLKKASFRKGEDIVKARVVGGDHLFVERVSYNFRRPERGETIVFRSERHPGMTADTHYIKRLVGLGGEKIRIGDDRHTYINGRALTTNDYGFEYVFGFDPAKPPQSDQYSGHVNGTVWHKATGYSGPTPNFPDEKTEVQIRPKHYVCFGDNTMNSADSRYWGEPDFPQERVIGKSWFVFWPFTKRFGWGQH